MQSLHKLRYKKIGTNVQNLVTPSTCRKNEIYACNVLQAHEVKNRRDFHETRKNKNT